jgi:hypothetical protein
MRLARFGPRRAAALLAALLMTVGLSACKTHVGAAAYVGSYRITEKQVNSYVTAQAKPYSQSDTTTGATSTVYPKSYVLNSLIETRLVQQVLALHGGTPTTAETTTAHQAVLKGAGFSDASLRAAISKRGFAGSFEQAYLRFYEVVHVLAARTSTGGTISAAIAKQITSAAARVRISPQYGTWNAKTLQITGGQVTPSFLRLDRVAPAA